MKIRLELTEDQLRHLSTLQLNHQTDLEQELNQANDNPRLQKELNIKLAFNQRLWSTIVNQLAKTSTT